MNYALLRRTTTARQATLEKELREAKATVAAAEKELKSLAGILGALKGVEGAAMPRGRGMGMAKKRKGGKWRPGHPGRPPKWYQEEQRKLGKGKRVAKPARKAKRKKRTASPKMLAALAKARAARAAKRAGAEPTTGTSTGTV